MGVFILVAKSEEMMRVSKKFGFFG